MKKGIFTLCFMMYVCQLSAQLTPTKRTYLELNAGMARVIDDEFYFPGVSFLVGQQVPFAKLFFVEYQAGLALPSIVTAKVGLGIAGNHVGLSGGFRVFPNFYYGQAHIRFNNGQLNFSFEASPFAQTDFESLSFQADRIFTCGYQWNIGKSRH
jgi:hypothetical protein